MKTLPRGFVSAVPYLVGPSVGAPLRFAGGSSAPGHPVRHQVIGRIEGPEVR